MWMSPRAGEPHSRQVIPRCFHQIWLGRESFPAEYRRRQATWLDCHPGWELRFWTEGDLPAVGDVRRAEIFERLRSPRERVDLLRLEVLCRYGGVYVDADLECRRSIEQLLAGAEFFISRAGRGRVETTVVGAIAAHPVLARALDEVRPREYAGYDAKATGSRFLDRLLENEPGITYVDRALFDPQSSSDVAPALSTRQAGSWGARVERLWQALLKAEKRADAAKKEARKWRAKYEEVALGPRPSRGGESQTLPAQPRKPAQNPLGTAMRSSLQVPRVFHQIWLGPDPLPEEYAAYQQSWLCHHPDWALHFWTEDNLPQRLRRPEAAERLRAPVERANILRLEVVWRFGGVYLDADLECLGSIEQLLGDAAFFAVLRGSGVADNYFFGAVAGHPILDLGLDRVKPQTTFGYRNKPSGPRFLNALIADHRDEILLVEPPRLKRYAIHHSRRTSADPEALHLELVKAKLDMQAAIHDMKDGHTADAGGAQAHP